MLSTHRLRHIALVTSLLLSQSAIVSAQSWRIEELPDLCTVYANGEYQSISLRLGQNGAGYVGGFIAIDRRFPLPAEGSVVDIGFVFRSGATVTPVGASATFVGNGLFMINGHLPSVDMSRIVSLMASEASVDFDIANTVVDRFDLSGSRAAIESMAHCASDGP